MRVSGRIGLIGVVVAALAGQARAGDVIISEILASNRATSLDSDGDESDWIELYNASAAPVDLAGWHLTDDPANLAKWTFPATPLGPGQFLVVYASEKDRATAGAELHTNFRLETDGEYLALVRPDGVTIESQLAPKYPEQYEDISYGVTFDVAASAAVQPGALARFFVPADDSLGLTWTATSFDDAAWQSGPTGLGYDRKSSPTYKDLIATDVETVLYRVNSSIFVRIAFDVPSPGAVDLVKLRLRYEDGFLAYINGVEVARDRVPAVVRWNSRAAGARPDAEALAYKDIFIDASTAGLVAGKNVLSFQALNDSSSSTDFFLLPEVELLDVQGVRPGGYVYSATPGPGLPTTEGFASVAAAPDFSHPSGTYTDPIAVTLATSEPGAVVHYTLDRTPPDESSPIYSAPLSIQATTMLRTRAYRTGALPSPIVSESFIFLASNLATFTSNLPLLVIDTFGRGVSDAAYVPGFGVLVEPGEDGRASLIGEPSLAMKVNVKWRGSSSLGFPKKNHALETLDENLRDKDVSVLGLEPESDWILHGPYSDKTLMRNYLSYDYSNRIGRWAVKCRFIEMYINSSPGKVSTSSYVGVYVLMEKIKRGKDRVDIQRLYSSQTTEPEISGGYIFKKDRLDPGDAGFATGAGTLAYFYPTEQEITPSQKDYVKRFFQTYEAALNGGNFKDPVNGYPKYIDADSFIDHHIIVELTKNIDGYRLSTFMFKDKEGKLNMGPVWDYNLSLGNADYLQGWDPAGWYYPQLGAGDYPWYGRLFLDPAFKARYRERWIEHRVDKFKITPMLAQIDEIAAYLDESQTRNFKKWVTLGTYVWPNKFIGKTYQEEIDFMKGWLHDRILWIDSQFIATPTLSQNGGAVDPGFKFTINASEGSVYYTLDGTDPRAEDESVAPGAQPYTDGQEITISKNTKVIARVKLGGLWSGAREATFITDVPRLVVTEVMFNPPPPPDGSPYRATDFEFIEVYNADDKVLTLAGFRFSRGVTFDFTSSADVVQLQPGEYALVVKSPEAFATRYETTGLKVLGAYLGDLSDRSEALELRGPLDEPILNFTYRDTWQPETDGLGRSLVIVDPQAALSSWGDETSWRASGELLGSPGRADTVAPGGLQLPGDFNQDGLLNLSDGVGILRHLFQGLEPNLPCDGETVQDPANLALLDHDGNGQIQLTDAVNLLTYLFLAGKPPVLGTECVRIEGCRDICVP